MSLQKQNLFYLQEGKSSKIKPTKALVHGLTQYYRSSNSALYDFQKDDLYRCMRVLLVFGRIIGIVPISGVFSSALKSVSFRARSFAGITSAIIILGMAINDLLALYAFFRAPAKDASEIARNAAGFVCYGIGLYVFVFMFRNSTKLITCFHKWRETKTVFYKEDTDLFRSITLISGIIYSSAILENLVSHWRFFNNPYRESTKMRIPVWEAYYERSHGQYANVIPYNVVLAIGVFLCNKWAVYAWNFGDILIAVIARAVYQRFKLHHEDLKSKISVGNGTLFNGTIERAELKSRTSCIGFGGLDCFTITKPFVLSVVSVIFTFEIVLLQSSTTPISNSTDSN
ncbi:unnamed protein product [Orchesella dallaii]|uniref:Gustatory receptor n=1 Tax=Orchesella dallaii TaxID=48710 RepID=A0ABP1Q8J5_9HEXA